MKKEIHSRHECKMSLRKSHEIILDHMDVALRKISSGYIQL